MKIDTLDQQQIVYEEQWNPSNDHWVKIDDKNRIKLIFTIPARVEDFKYGDDILKNIGYVNREAFVFIKKCILSKGAACYIDIENEEIHFHRLILTTDFNDLENTPSEFLLNVDCLDSDENYIPVDDVKIEKSKKFKKRSRYKVTPVRDESKGSFIMRLDDQGEYDFKITATVRGDKLKCYLNCHRS